MPVLPPKKWTERTNCFYRLIVFPAPGCTHGPQVNSWHSCPQSQAIPAQSHRTSTLMHRQDSDHVWLVTVRIGHVPDSHRFDGLCLTYFEGASSCSSLSAKM